MTFTKIILAANILNVILCGYIAFIRPEIIVFTSVFGWVNSSLAWFLILKMQTL